jgi:hypothetical protein
LAEFICIGSPSERFDISDAVASLWMICTELSLLFPPFSCQKTVRTRKRRQFQGRTSVLTVRTIYRLNESRGKAMRFRDSPIATAVMGIAFALILLGVLSYPAFIGAAPNMTFGLAKAQSSTTNQGAASLTSVESSVTYNSVTAVTTATPVLASVTSGTLVVNSTGMQSSTNSSAKANMTAGQGGNTDTVTASVTEGGTTIMEVSTVAASSSTSDTASSEVPSVSPDISGSYALTSTGKVLDIFGLSIVSLVIAAGSMLFISRKLNSDEKPAD